MDNKIRCQSCGMPLSEQFGNLGTDAGGAPVSEYCIFCFAGGAFTNPHQTLAEMIESSVENMTSDLGMSLDEATALANSFIPTLKRWQT